MSHKGGEASDLCSPQDQSSCLRNAELCLLTHGAPHTGLHGAAVAITGRRQPVLDSAVKALSDEGITVIGLQVHILSLATEQR